MTTLKRTDGLKHGTMRLRSGLRIDREGRIVNIDRTTLLRTWGPILLLLVVVALAWCSANGIWSLAALAEPTAYIEDSEKSDIIHQFALLKATTRGEFPLLSWKTVAHLGAPFTANWNDWPMVEELLVQSFGLLAKVFGLFAGLNIAILLGNVLAAATFFGVARHLGCRPKIGRAHV